MTFRVTALALSTAFALTAAGSALAQQAADWGPPPSAPNGGPQWGPPPGAAPSSAPASAPVRTVGPSAPAQAAAPPQPQGPSWGPPPGAGPQGMPPRTGGGTQAANQVVAPPGQMPCQNDILPMRAAIERDGGVVKSSIEKKADRAVICGSLKKFAVTEAKFVNYLTTNQQWCGVPPEIITQLKKNHGHTLKLRGQACAAGPTQAQRPAGSGLSEALGTTRGPVGPVGNKNSGTFGTLTGSTLAR